MALLTAGKKEEQNEDIFENGNYEGRDILTISELIELCSEKTSAGDTCNTENCKQF